MNATLKTVSNNTSPQIRLSKVSATHWRVTFDNPPLNLMGPQFVVEFGKIVTAIENEYRIRIAGEELSADLFATAGTLNQFISAKLDLSPPKAGRV